MTVSVFGVTQGWLSSTRSWETTIPVCLVDNVQDESKNYFLCSLRCTLCLYMSVFCNHMLIKAGYGSLKVSSTDDIPKPITPIKTQPIETRTKQKSGRVRILQYSTSPVDQSHQNASISVSIMSHNLALPILFMRSLSSTSARRPQDPSPLPSSSASWRIAISVWALICSVAFA